MKATFSEAYSNKQTQIEVLLSDFESRGKTLDAPARNTIKVFELEGEKITIKSFKIPNLINKIVYRYFRKSKAERSFQYASILKEKGIGTPEPIGFVEDSTGITFGKSYYISKHVDYDLTYRELVSNPDDPEHEEILRAFTRFTYELHENRILFLDHSPGNTLIKKVDSGYQFYLVDLNRMVFKELSETERFMNFSRLTPNKEMVAIMAEEYAKLINSPKSEVFSKMWYFTEQFQNKYWRKQRIKRFLRP